VRAGPGGKTMTIKQSTIDAAALLLALLTAACGGGTEPAASETDESDRAKTGYEQSLDKARAVEGRVLEAAEKKKQQIEEQEGGG
jgi:hypothetical protein